MSNFPPSKSLIDSRRFDRNLKAIALYRDSAPNFDGLELYIGDEQGAQFNFNLRQFEKLRRRSSNLLWNIDEPLHSYVIDLFYLRTSGSVLALLQEYPELECLLDLNGTSVSAQNRQITIKPWPANSMRIELVFANNSNFQLLSCPTELARFEKYWRWVMAMWIQNRAVSFTVDRSYLLKRQSECHARNHSLHQVDPVLHHFLHAK